MNTLILSTHHLTKHFGGLRAVDDCNLDIQRNEITGLIGPNGAGKTTAFNLICGYLNPSAGEIIFDQRNITAAAPHRRARLGIGRTFQIMRVFKGMTVWDNLYLVPRRRDAGKSDQEPQSEKVKSIMETVGIDELSEVRAGNLPYGKQRLVEFARTLMTDPKLVLMDEIFAGLNHDEIERLVALIRRLKDKTSISFLVIDHAVSIVLKLCEQIIVLNYGKILATGSPDQIKDNEDVIEAYLGRAVEESTREGQ